MGNNPSTHSKSSSASPASSTHGQHQTTPTGSNPAPSSERRREPKLRESVHGQKGAPPESSQVQARGTTTHRTRPSQGQKEQPSSQPPSYAQAQAYSHSYSQSNSPSQLQSQSPRQYSPYPPPQPLSSSQNASPAANNTPYSNSPKERASNSQPRPQAPKSDSYRSTPIKSSPPVPVYSDEPSKPVAVPQPVNTSTTIDSSNDIQSPPFAHNEHAGMVADTMSYHLTRPPRLPLPIEEEVHTPGSPILGPADAQAPLPDLDPLEMGEVLTRPLTPTETDDEDGEELPVDRSKPTVRTLFTWHGDVNASKLFVTGTIFQWSRKHKLDAVPGKPGYFEGWVNVRPGTHHIRFIVDGNMSLSPDLPTTVDFGNNLVNYIEVSADNAEPPQEEHDASQISQQSQQDQLTPHESHQGEESPEHTGKPPIRTKPVLGREHYTPRIPQYLLDLDKAEDSAAYQYAAAAIVKLPTPPSLPGFMGKPILNAATPMKDDNSVLNMPNHTVLNHLATSSIKGNVLAVSATTRYKRKYVTTIMYKPTSDDTT